MLRSFPLMAVLYACAIPAMAADCSAEINSTDQMTFDKKIIEVDKSCTAFTIRLNHTGAMPVAAMGHNWVLAKTADVEAISNDGLSAGPAQGYLKPEDSRIIAHTRMIGGGESDTITINVTALPTQTPLEFFCSFPGHRSLMRGAFQVSR